MQKGDSSFQNHDGFDHKKNFLIFPEAFDNFDDFREQKFPCWCRKSFFGGKKNSRRTVKAEALQFETRPTVFSRFFFSQSSNSLKHRQIFHRVCEYASCIISWHSVHVSLDPRRKLAATPAKHWRGTPGGHEIYTRKPRVVIQSHFNTRIARSVTFTAV